MGLIRHAPALSTSTLPRPGSLGGFEWKGWGASFGFGLFDTIISIALVVVLTAGAYVLFGPSTTASATSQESQRLDALVRSIDASYVSGVNYDGLSQTPFAVPGFQSTTSAWGQPFSVLPTQVATPADGWVATYQGVATDVCAQLGAGQLNTQQWFAVQVDGQPVADGNALRTACSKPTDASGLHSLAFVRYTGVRPNGTTGLAPLCFDRTREQVEAEGAEVGCPTDPSVYLPGRLQ